LVLLSVRWRFSGQSSFRSPKHNEVVGGDPESRHLFWLALDITLDDWGDTEAFVKEAYRQGVVALYGVDKKSGAPYIHIQPPKDN